MVEAVAKVDLRGEGAPKSCLGQAAGQTPPDWAPATVLLGKPGKPTFFISRCTILLPILSCLDVSVLPGLDLAWQENVCICRVKPWSTVGSLGGLDWYWERLM